MSDLDTSAGAASSGSPAKKGKKSTRAAASKKPRTVASHPKVADMVTSAIGNLKERGGSSLQAIKKYITVNYKVDVEKLAPFIRRFLKSAVANGTLIQMKGKGASGSFKLGGGASAKPAKATVAKKPAKATKPVKKVEKKVAKPKKRSSTASVAKAKKVKKPKPAKSPKKEKKAKTPKKPAKSPKPKKAAAKRGAKK